MVNRCCVAYCATKPRSKLGFFPFPLNDPDLCSQWIQVCCQPPNWVPDSTSRVCQAHFSELDFLTFQHGKHMRRKLRNGVSPSLNLPPRPLVVTVMSENGMVKLETVETDGTHYDSIEHVSQEDLNSISVDDSGSLHESLDLDDESMVSTHKIKNMKSTFDPSFIPDDVAANTLNIDNGYFLNFLPVIKTENLEDSDDVSEVVEAMEEVDPSDVLGSVKSERELEFHKVLEIETESDEFPSISAHIQNLSPDKKIARLVNDLRLALRKNRSLARANKSLRLQLHQASKKTLSQKSKHEIAREVLAPFFTPTQIDCFCRPKWLRSRNWTNKDFEIALSLRKLMSKKAFGFLRKKRMIPMPSLTSLRKYQRQHGIVIHHTTHKGTGQSNTKKAACGNSKKQTVKKISQGSIKQTYSNTIVIPSSSIQTIMADSSLTSFVQNRNVVMTPIEASTLLGASTGIPFASMEGSKIIQLPLTTSTVVDENGQQIQLQVVETLSSGKMGTKLKNIDENWKLIQISSCANGSSTYAIHQK